MRLEFYEYQLIEELIAESNHDVLGRLKAILKFDDCKERLAEYHKIREIEIFLDMGFKTYQEFKTHSIYKPQSLVNTLCDNLGLYWRFNGNGRLRTYYRTP